MEVGQSSAQSVNWPTATPATPSRTPGPAQVQQHPVHLVRRLADLLQQQDRAAQVGLVHGADGGGQQAEVAAEQGARWPGAAEPYRRGLLVGPGREHDRVGGHQAPGAATRPTPAPVRSSHPGRPGPVHGGQPGAAPQRQLQRGDVGEADHHLRVARVPRPGRGRRRCAARRSRRGCRARARTSGRAGPG